MKETILRWLKRAGVVIVVLAVMYMITLAAATSKLKHAYQVFEDKGYPMSLTEIVPAQLPDHDNAALIYQATFLQLQSASHEYELYELGELAGDVCKDTVTPEMKRIYIEAVDHAAINDALRSLDQVIDKTGCRFPLDYNDGLAMELPHLAQLRSLSRIVCANARIASDAGQAEQAWHNCLLSLYVAGALEEEPLLMSQLVRNALFALSINTIAYVASKQPLPDELSAPFSMLIGRHTQMEPMTRAIHIERLVLGDNVYSIVRNHMVQALGDAEGIEILNVTPSWLIKPYCLLDQAAYLRIMFDYTTLAENVLAQGKVSFQDAPDSEMVKGYIISSLIVPAIDAAIGQHVKAIAKARLSLTALAVIDYSREKGQFPEELSEIGSVSLVDPFTGGSFVYEVHPNGFTLSSHGEEGFYPGSDKGLDIMWEYSKAQ